MKSIVLSLLVAIALPGLAGCSHGTEEKPELSGTWTATPGIETPISPTPGETENARRPEETRTTGYRLPEDLEYLAGEVTVKFRTDIKPRRELKDKGVSPEEATREQFQVLTTESSINEINMRFGVYDFRGRSFGEEYPDLQNLYTFYVPPETDIENLVNAYLEDPNVEYAQPNFLMISD